MHFHTFTFRKAFSRWPSLSGKTPVLLFPFNAFTYYHDYLQFMHKPPICQDLCLKNTPHHAYSLCNRPIYPADARCLFRGRFGISVLSGFPDNHPSWQENFSKLTLSSHVRPETLPALMILGGKKSCRINATAFWHTKLFCIHRNDFFFVVTSASFAYSVRHH